MSVLIKNEWLKLIKKKSSWIMWILLAAMTFGITLLVKSTVKNQSGEVMMKANDLFASLTEMTSFLNLFIVVVAASIVAEEFSRGTIKFLLIRPYTRSQILFSKFVACLIYSVIGTVILYGSSLISANLLLGAQSPFAVVKGYHGWNALTVAGAYAGANLLLILLYITITLFISAAIRSQSLAVGVGLGVLFGSSIINSFLNVVITEHQWLKWNPFNMLNIKNTIMENGEAANNYPGYLNFWQMTAGILVYSFIIYLVMQLLFKKRDVSLS
ncbi:ABC transporter permease [Candidatus Enterococcus ikei]|uniref:ABC transporter permease n=1 Tax=Candidatus Enterococcus ikei TaxID=2815326 RepID=A0ABS3GY41_9ENTE|nr:ABC transporter permease subunit [Enterococcus sp. DIV0869a]MBO0440175.1 ABC transporter permease [Enterococcus sp. DIV0869a]